LAGAPDEATPARLHSSPPKRLLGLADDIAPRKPDIVQVAIRPMGQFTPLASTVPPDIQPAAESGPISQFMMICHHFR
jgi:hypothetical protein